jgi:hypothetical protein
MAYPILFDLDSRKNEMKDDPITLLALQHMDQTTKQVKQALEEMKLTHSYATCCVSFSLSNMANPVLKRIGKTSVDVDCLTQEYLNKIEKVIHQFDEELTEILKAELPSESSIDALEEFKEEEKK